MAPIKFEEHVKEKLDERKIQPSADSWDKLSSRLNNDADKKSGRKWWISAVAAVAVLIIASFLFLNQQEQISDNPIVETPVEETIQENSQKTDSEVPVEIASEENDDRVKQEITKPNIQTTEVKNSGAEVAVNDNKNPKENSVLTSNNNQRILLEPISIEPPVIKDEMEIQVSGKIQELIAKVSREEEKSGSITAAEVDALLAEAAREISSERKYDQGHVTAKDLLADVEFEVDQSFRKEVFEVLKEGFLKARSAIATRND